MRQQQRACHRRARWRWAWHWRARGSGAAAVWQPQCGRGRPAAAWQQQQYGLLYGKRTRGATSGLCTRGSTSSFYIERSVSHFGYMYAITTRFGTRRGRARGYSGSSAATRHCTLSWRHSIVHRVTSILSRRVTSTSPVSLFRHAHTSVASQFGGCSRYCTLRRPGSANPASAPWQAAAAAPSGAPGATAALAASKWLLAIR